MQNYTKIRKNANEAQKTGATSRLLETTPMVERNMKRVDCLGGKWKVERGTDVERYTPKVSTVKKRPASYMVLRLTNPLPLRPYHEKWPLPLLIGVPNVVHSEL